MADDVPDQGRPIGPARPEVPVERAGRASEWSIEWWGILPVLAIALAAIVGWRATGGTGTGPDERRTGGVAVTTTEPVAAATTSAAATTTSTTVATTVPTTGTSEPAEPTEPAVHIVGEMKPCRFGDDCLVASFTIEGFDAPSGRFTCIYPNSTREFSFQDDYMLFAEATRPPKVNEERETDFREAVEQWIRAKRVVDVVVEGRIVRR